MGRRSARRVHVDLRGGDARLKLGPIPQEGHLVKALPYLLCLGLASSGYVAGNLKSYTEAPVVPAGLDAHETNAAASVIGQFRTTTTGWLWLRTDLYLHNGVE